MGLTLEEMERLLRNYDGTESGGARMVVTDVTPHHKGARRLTARAYTFSLAYAKKAAPPRGASFAVLSTQAYAPALGCTSITVRSIDQWTPMPECAAHAYRERWKQSVPLDLV